MRQKTYSPDRTSSPNTLDYSDVLLYDLLEIALQKLNPSLPLAALEEAIKEVKNIYSPQLIEAKGAVSQVSNRGHPREHAG
ncbi:MAG: hypothetical protein LLG37_03115 [Spirochaetia bacterium]|nr:hypothetical protein [Spirochaetia bacterium]